MSYINKFSDVSLHLENIKTSAPLYSFYEQMKSKFPANYKDFELFNSFNDNSISEIEIRDYQTKLRNDAIARFNGTCPISGIKELNRLETAHIKPVSECINLLEKTDCDNVILMWMDLHKYFDSFKFSINPDTFIIEVNSDNKEEWLNNFNGKKIQLVEENKLYLTYHYNKFKNLI